MLDFSPYSIKRARSKAYPTTSDDRPTLKDDAMSIDDDTRSNDSQWTEFSHEPLEIDVVDDMSCIEMGKVWKDDVWSGLPYVRIRKEMGIVASGVMIDDQRVMMIAVSCLHRR
jgi:hypothetical protein